MLKRQREKEILRRYNKPKKIWTNQVLSIVSIIAILSPQLDILCIHKDLVRKAKSHWKCLRQLRIIIQQIAQLIASHVTISTCFPLPIDHTTNIFWQGVTTGQGLLQKTLLDLQAMQWWVLVLQMTSPNGWHILKLSARLLRYKTFHSHFSWFLNFWKVLFC